MVLRKCTKTGHIDVLITSAQRHDGVPLAPGNQWLYMKGVSFGNPENMCGDLGDHKPTRRDMGGDEAGIQVTEGATSFGLRQRLDAALTKLWPLLRTSPAPPLDDSILSEKDAWHYRFQAVYTLIDEVYALEVTKQASPELQKLRNDAVGQLDSAQAKLRALEGQAQAPETAAAPLLVTHCISNSADSSTTSRALETSPTRDTCCDYRRQYQTSPSPWSPLPFSPPPPSGGAG